MKKITLKIINNIAKKQNSSVIEVFSVFFANIVAGNNDFEKVALKIFDLKKIEKKEILKDFFEYLKNDIARDKEEFSKNLCVFASDFKESAINLGAFFAIFLPQDVIFSKDAQKIRDSLSVYPDEVKDTIIKALEFLSMLLVEELEDNVKCEIFKNIVDIMIVLGEVVKIMKNGELK